MRQMRQQGKGIVGFGPYERRVMRRDERMVMRSQGQNKLIQTQPNKLDCKRKG